MAVLAAQEVERFLARPDPARAVVLVYGPDAGLASERAQAILRTSVDNPGDSLAVTRMAGDDLAGDPARLVDEAQAIPMFGGRRAIWVRAGARNFASAIELLTAAPIRDCRVVVEAGDLKRNAPLRTVCERAPSVTVIPCYADSARDIDRLIGEDMRQANLAIDADARAALVALLGEDRRVSRSEIGKLALYAQGRERVTLDDVLAVVTDASAQALDSGIDAAFAGRARELDLEWEKAVGDGTTPATIVAAALRQALSLHKARLAVEAGVAVADAMGPHVFFKRKPAVEAALKSWNALQLMRAVQALAAAALRIRQTPALADSIGRQTLFAVATQARSQRAA